MTDAEALILRPGDYIQLRRQPTWGSNPPQCWRFTVSRVEGVLGDVRIVTTDDFRCIMAHR